MLDSQIKVMLEQSQKLDVLKSEIDHEMKRRMFDLDREWKEL